MLSSSRATTRTRSWAAPYRRPVLAPVPAAEGSLEGRGNLSPAFIQGTRPHTLEAALRDSPLGPAAWLVEKFHESKSSKDELLTNTTILPQVTPSVASFVPFVRTGQLIFVSGHIARRNGEPWVGRLAPATSNHATLQGGWTAQRVRDPVNVSWINAFDDRVS